MKKLLFLALVVCGACAGNFTPEAFPKINAQAKAHLVQRDDPDQFQSAIQLRDLKRIIDIQQIEDGMKRYYAQNHHYPATVFVNGQGLPDQIEGSPNLAAFLAIWPTPPLPADGNCPLPQGYNYLSRGNGATYTVSFCLGGKALGFASGIHILSPATIQ